MQAAEVHPCLSCTHREALVDIPALAAGFLFIWPLCGWLPPSGTCNRCLCADCLLLVVVGQTFLRFTAPLVGSGALSFYIDVNFVDAWSPLWAFPPHRLRSLRGCESRLESPPGTGVPGGCEQQLGHSFETIWLAAPSPTTRSARQYRC